MAYETGTPSSIADLVSKLFTFAVAEGWTQDELASNYGTIHRNNVYVSFRWDGTNHNLAVYQSLGWSSSLQPHQQANDSGQGVAGATITSGRRVNFLVAGPYIGYHFFASDDAPYYIHIVVEVETGRYRHLGFGELIKIGAWTGGEYAYSHFWEQTSSNPYTVGAVAHTFLLDGATNPIADAATIHAEGMPNQHASGKWLVCTNSAAGNDRADIARKNARGCSRGGLLVQHLSWIRYSVPNALKIIIPVEVVYFETGQLRFLGRMRDLGIVNLHAFVPGEEVTVGAETWMVFPWTRKRRILSGEESWNAGVAYRKIV